MPGIRLLLVDASEIFRDGLANLLQSESNIDVVSVSNKISQVVKAAGHISHRLCSLILSPLKIAVLS